MVADAMSGAAKHPRRPTPWRGNGDPKPLEILRIKKRFGAQWRNTEERVEQRWTVVEQLRHGPAVVPCAPEPA